MLALYFGRLYWSFLSAVVAWSLRLRGVRVGSKFYAEAFPILKAFGSTGNIRIGDNVRFTGRVEIRNREGGSIRIGSGAKIDHGVRLLAANNAALVIGEKTNIAPYCQLNCGADVTIGRKVLIAAFTVIQSSSHGIRPGEWIKDQPHEHAPIQIGDDVWIGAHASILMGASVGRGAVVGAGAVVTKSIRENVVAVGVPAKEVRTR